MIFFNMLFFIFILNSFQLQAMKALLHAKPILSHAEFKILGKHAKTYLQENINHLACQKNESGFVRFTIPKPKNLNHIEKIRLNYWGKEKVSNIDPETIHNHPRYFESIIVNGGYLHALYNKHLTGNYTRYDNYRILKNIYNQKKFMYVGPSQLKFEKTEKTKANSIINVPPSLIHQVIKTEPSTLSLNVVFKNENNNDTTYYDVYLSEQAKITDIKTERSILINEETYYLTHEVIKPLTKFVE